VVAEYDPITDPNSKGNDGFADRGWGQQTLKGLAVLA
jgi:hypothetical protein